jgi:D-inositol-3-phosphate glycosyltransferase
MQTKRTYNNRLPVFYVEPVGGHRGMHYYDFELCLALQLVDVDVTLLTCDETENTAIPPSLHVEFPFQSIYGNTPKAVRGLRYLRGMVSIGLTMQRRGVPLAHFHYFHFPPLDYLYLKWLHLIGKHFVFTAHDVFPFDARSSDLTWLRRLYHEADRIIVHAESNLDTIVGKFEISPERVRVIPMGPYLDFAEEQKLPASLAKQRLGLEPNTPVVLFFGQIKKVKGLQYLIRAFRQVVDQYPSVQLIIAGPEWKESFDGYATLIRELNLADRVLTRIEYVPDEEVGVYYSAADVVALPYTEAYQSAVLYMAYSFARPVIASTVGGLAEVVEDGVTGLLVPPADVNQLANALLALLQDTEMAKVMGEQGRMLVETKFGWPEIARKTAAVYAQVLRRNRPGA